MKHKRLVLIRHAHRDTENHSLDNGLSEKGNQQVQKLLHFSKTKELDGAVYLSSPKKRCLETISPLAKIAGSSVKIEPALGEGASFSQIEEFIEHWKYEGPDLLVVCSHGDVIPMMVEKITGGLISIKKAGWCEIELVGRDAYLTGLI